MGDSIDFRTELKEVTVSRSSSEAEKSGRAVQVGTVFGSQQISPLVSLAPMAGVTDIPFRRQVKAFGGRYCVSEMVACEQLARARLDMVRRAAGAGAIAPLVIQLAG
ncbi:MAG TPA: hypothetical protein DHW63_03610, partial [Hyphomonadaceae bacterium]|nr:hypothetical protein [Hyphomonadaceae bacterium]